MKTLLDIYNSADASAKAAAALSTEFAAEQKSIADFESDGGDPLDWPQWKNFFTSRLGQIRNWTKTLSPSAQTAAKSAAAAKPAPASPPVLNQPTITNQK